MGTQFISASIKKMMKWVIIATFLATNVLSKSFLIETVDEEDNRRRGIDDTGAQIERRGIDNTGAQIERRAFETFQDTVGPLGEDYHNSGLPCNAAQGFDPLACLDAAGQLPQITTSVRTNPRICHLEQK